MFEMAEIKVEKFEIVDVITTSDVEVETTLPEVNIPDMTALG